MSHVDWLVGKLFAGSLERGSGGGPTQDSGRSGVPGGGPALGL